MSSVKIINNTINCHAINIKFCSSLLKILILVVSLDLIENVIYTSFF